MYTHGDIDLNEKNGLKRISEENNEMEQDLNNAYSGQICVVKQDKNEDTNTISKSSEIKKSQSQIKIFKMKRNASQPLIIKKKENKEKKIAGISLVSLVITIIVIIILAAIVMMASNNTVGMANYGKFVHELSEIQDKVTIKRNENQVEGVGEEIKNKGFTKVEIERAPSKFVSFDEDKITGYWVRFDTNKKKEIKTGREELKENKVEFRRDDVYVYDQEGTVYYAKGWYDENEVLHYNIDSVEEGELPQIISVTYVLIEGNTKAKVTVIAEPAEGGSLKVTVGGKTANNTEVNTYEAKIEKNGEVLVKVTETNGGVATQTIKIEGIATIKDTTAPIITNLTSNENGTNVIISGAARDNESNIIGYAFTDTNSEPESWISVNVSSINKTYTATNDGTYTFWVKNEDGLVNSQTINVTMPKVKEKYTITYDANGGNLDKVVSSQEKTEDINVNLDGNKPSRNGYEFLGWATNKGATTGEYQPGDIYTKNANLKLYAVWKESNIQVSSLTIESIANQVYTGSPITPNPTVKDGTTILTKDTHYSLKYSNNTNAGTANIIITGKGKYTGTKMVSFTIERKAISVPTGVTLTYTGNELTGITATTQYTVGGTTKATDVGTYKATVTPTANYKWSDGTTTAKEVSWTITASTDITLTITPTSYTYDGSNKTPTITVKFGTTTLTKDTDYTVSGTSAAKDAGTYTIKVTGKGNYAGEKSATYTIERKAINVPTGATLTYTGSEQTGITSTAQYTVGGTTKATDVGTYKATVTPTANYKWSDGTTADKAITWKINKATVQAPTNVAISTAGVVTWTASSNATGYEISIDNKTWETATNGVNYNSKITAATGSRTVYVRAVNSDTTNYATPSANATKAVTVCELTINKGTGISSVSGAGKYISGSSVSISATASTGYTWSEWTVEAGSTPASTTTASTTVTVSAATTLKANANANGLTFNAQTLTAGTYNTEYSASFTGASKGTGTYAYSVNSVTCGGTAVTASSGKYNGLSLSGTTISGTPTKAGTYVFSIKATDSNSGATKNANITIVINKVTLIRPTKITKTYTYSGVSQTLALNDYSSSTMNIDRNTGIDAKDYTATISIKDKNNYVWADNSTSDISITWSIAKKPISVEWESKTSFVYNGKPQAPTVTTPVNGVNGEVVNLERTTYTNVVTNHTSTASIASVTGGQANKENYTLTGNTKTFSIVSVPIALTVSISGENKCGQTLTAVTSATPNDARLEYQWYTNSSDSTTGGTAIAGAIKNTYNIDSETVGEYIYVMVKASKTNYTTVTKYDITDASNNGSATVGKISMMKPELEQTEFEYTGSTITPILRYFNESTMLCTGTTSAITGGVYTMVVSIIDTSMYQWSDGGTGNLTFEWTIKQTSTSHNLKVGDYVEYPLNLDHYYNVPTSLCGTTAQSFALNSKFNSSKALFRVVDVSDGKIVLSPNSISEVFDLSLSKEVGYDSGLTILESICGMYSSDYGISTGTVTYAQMSACKDIDELSTLFTNYTWIMTGWGKNVHDGGGYYVFDSGVARSANSTTDNRASILYSSNNVVTNAVIPAITLNSNLNIYGEGTKENPYTLSLNSVDRSIKVGDYIKYPLNLDNYFTTPTSQCGTTAQTFTMSDKFDSDTAIFRVLEVTDDGIIICPNTSSQTFSLSIAKETGYNNGISIVKSICGLYNSEYGSSVEPVTYAQMRNCIGINELSTLFTNSSYLITGWGANKHDGGGYYVFDNGVARYANYVFDNQAATINPTGNVIKYQVTPAIKLNSNVKVSGIGTKASPYTLTIVAENNVLEVGDYVEYPLNLDNYYTTPLAQCGTTAQTFDMSEKFASETAVFRVVELTDDEIILCPNSTSQLFSLSLAKETGYDNGISIIKSVCALYNSEYGSSEEPVTYEQMSECLTVNELSTLFTNLSWQTEGWGKNVHDGGGYYVFDSGVTRVSNSTTNKQAVNLLPNNFVATYPVLPAIKLKSNVILTGVGTKASPYKLTLVDNNDVLEVGDYVEYPINLANNYTTSTAECGTTAQTFDMSAKFDSDTAVFRVVELTDEEIILSPNSSTQLFNLSLSKETGYDNGIEIIKSVCALYDSEYGTSVEPVTYEQMSKCISVNELSTLFANLTWQIEEWGKNVHDGGGYYVFDSGVTKVSSATVNKQAAILHSSNNVETYSVTPAIKLNSNVKLTGEGTKASPYKLSLITVGSEVASGKIKVGDTIIYTPVAAKYRPDDTKTGDSRNVELETDLSATWRVLSINETAKTIKVTTESVSNTNIYLAGATGYIKGAGELNTISEKLYSNTAKGIIARSMTIEDLDEACGYDKTTYSDYGTKYAYYKKSDYVSGTTDGYTNAKHTTRYSNGYTEPRFYAYEEEGETKIVESETDYKVPTAEKPVKLTYTWYMYDSATLGTTNSSIVNEILGKGVDWLASPRVSAGNAGAGFVIFYTSYGSVGASYLVRSDGGMQDLSAGLRPLLDLGSDIQIEQQIEGVWKIK